MPGPSRLEQAGATLIARDAAFCSALPLVMERLEDTRRGVNDTRVLDLLADLEGLLQEPDRLLDLAQVGVGRAQVPEGVSLALPVADLTSDDPYNTYVNKGLPPGAIGSPSLDSLLAAVTPVEHSYYFYLADRNHVTHYSKTYEEHLRLKRKYLGS